MEGLIYKNQVIYTSLSKQLMLDIQHLLLKFGINSYLVTKEENEIDFYYKLLIKEPIDIIRFNKEIGIYSEKSYELNSLINNNINSNKQYDYLPKDILEIVEKDRLSQRLSKKNIYKDDIYNNDYIERSKLKEIATLLNNEDLKAFSEGEFIFDEIVSIESIGDKRTYDLSIPLTMNFVADDFITHNTETMVVEILYKACSNKNFRVLVAAPYENQIRNIFTRLNELIAESPLLKQTVKSSTKNPAKIEFDNGSMILGFTTGDDAASIRGQKADWIFIDEVDFMSEYCFEVVAAIAIERPEIGITVSSTPLGKRSKFYQMCTDKSMGYSQHYHPSTHNPNWNSQMEAELKAQLTAEGYVHEVLAEFGTQEKGVFNKEKLEAAKGFYNYAYNELDYFQKEKIEESGIAPIMELYDNTKPPPRNVFRTMGVD